MVVQGEGNRHQLDSFDGAQVKRERLFRIRREPDHEEHGFEGNPMQRSARPADRPSPPPRLLHPSSRTIAGILRDRRHRVLSCNAARAPSAPHVEAAYNNESLRFSRAREQREKPPHLRRPLAAESRRIFEHDHVGT
jgi:hypothetical protein